MEAQRPQGKHTSFKVLLYVFGKEKVYTKKDRLHVCTHKLKI